MPKVAIRRPILSLAYEPKMNIAAAARPGEVEIWSVEEQAVIHRLENLDGDVNAVAFSADGTRLFAAGGEPAVAGRIWIWSLAGFQADRHNRRTSRRHLLAGGFRRRQETGNRKLRSNHNDLGHRKAARASIS